MPTQTDRRWEYAPDAHGLVDDISDALVCREGRHFLLTDSNGSVPAGNTRGFGLYSGDTRHLSGYTLLLNGEEPLVLMSAANSGFSQEQVLGNRRGTYDGQEVSRGTIEIVRRRFLSRHLTDTVAVTNHNVFDVEVNLSYRFEADFADIFEVRGHVRTHAGSAIEPSADAESIQYRYLGADGEWRQTVIHFFPEPESISPSGAGFSILLPAGETRSLTTTIVTDWQGDAGDSGSFEAMQQSYAEWSRSFASVHTDNAVFNDVLDRAVNDLRSLWTAEPGGGGYFAAGVPWYSTLFGRDSIITSLQTLPLRPDLARECLFLLARYQSVSQDEFHVQEPGKILHEMRDSELTRIGELPYMAYYGSIDSTPLFLLLASDYFRWTNDISSLTALKEPILNALRWIREFGRPASDSYIRYRTDYASGLRNQGWKDSGDAIVHKDGSICDGPIALAEVQAYVYEAYVRMADLLPLLGETAMAESLREEAVTLRACFNSDFWLDDDRTLAFALDGENRPADIMSSNAGQVLWSGLLSRERAEHLRTRLFQPDMFTGWGIRTLSSNALRYFPLGYHVGTVWPHDNGLIALGLKRHGFDDEALELLTSLFDAAQRFPDRRLPELFGGQPRSPYLPPVPYPVACRPQAWAAGSLLQLFLATLGLRPDASRRELHITRPRLPLWIGRASLRGLCIGDSRLNISFERQGDETQVRYEVEGSLQVIVEAD